jgi:hypothetical protein
VSWGLGKEFLYFLAARIREIWHGNFVVAVEKERIYDLT